MARILGVDYGHKRIGLAVSDPSGSISLVLRVAEVRNAAEAQKAIVCAAEETEATCIVLGLPLNMDGSVGPMAEGVLRVVDELRAVVSVEVDTWDERLSTSMVERALISADVSRAKRRRVRDKLAAQVILQGYLDAHAGAVGQGRGSDAAL